MRMIAFAAAIAGIVGAAIGVPGAHAETVDLLLVLAADVSRSIDETEFNLQRKGYASAITDPRVLRAIAGGRNQAIAAGITINGLAIINTQANPGYAFHTQPPGGLPKYYEENVIGGPGAFLLQVENFDTFAEAITRKLVTEIAGAPPPSGYA